MKAKAGLRTQLHVALKPRSSQERCRCNAGFCHQMLAIGISPERAAKTAVKMKVQREERRSRLQAPARGQR
jgi:hypothetical protein